MSTLLLGNPQPHEAEGGPSVHHRNAGGGTLHRDEVTVSRELNPVLSSITTIITNAEDSIEKVIADIEHLWPHHSAADVPSYVTGDDEALAAAVRAHFGLTEPTPPTALLTNAGLDFFAAQAAGSASSSAVAKWIALTANSSAASATDTTLTGEITTGGGGLVRAAGTYAHTTGASTYTVTNTFASNGSDSLPVTVAKLGAFTASSAGSMVFETLLGTTATLSVSGDSLQVTWTITL